MLLLLLILVLAVAGGFLGDLLERAASLIAIMAVAGAIAGFIAYRFVRRLTDRWT